VILYVTYNDQPSGVYWSQVTDVVDHLNALGGQPVRLVALVSLRGYLRSRRLIRERSPSAIVLPMVPRQHNWRVNWIWLWVVCRLLRPSGAICRGIFATALALRLRDRGLLAQVCFDARAAYGAEWQEYRVVDDDRLIAECVQLERDVVGQADLRMAVSEALVEHWRKTLGYDATRHLVIPCTLGRSVEALPKRQQNGLRKELGWSPDDVVVVYSGTAVGWQSLELAEQVVSPWLAADARHRMLFLSTGHPVIERMKARFPQQVDHRWVPHRRVRAMLQDCDIGLLLREDRITNRVASPTKFAEYLSAGLAVAISDHVGDFSDLVQRERLGQVLRAGDGLALGKPPDADAERLMAFARERFTKEAFDTAYRMVKACMAAEPELPASSPFATHEPGPAVSIIVPSFNKRGFIGDMVRSVQAQTDGRWELIIVDDASSDGSVQLLQGMAAVDPRIVVIPLETNHGANHCRNLGIGRARGRCIIFLDADDLLAPHCVARRMAVMEGSGFHFSVSTMEVFRDRPGDAGHRWVPLTRDPIGDFFSHKLPWQTMQPIWDRSFLQVLGGFDPAFSRHQDVELHTRALLAPGVRFRLRLTEPDCYYRIAEERKVIDPQRLLRSFAESAVLYRRKFTQDAERLGRTDLLLGIIHRTYLQMLLYAKLRRIDGAVLAALEDVLLGPGGRSIPPGKRWLFAVTRWYNLLPMRIPGVNLVISKLITGVRR
jgi:glycosyltransferase involved in cell wall biosynthesis